MKDKEVSVYPSEQYADILKVLPEVKQRKVAEYVDEAFHSGDHITDYGVRTWKELVQHLVELESGTPYVTELQPIKDYLTYWKALEGED